MKNKFRNDLIRFLGFALTLFVLVKIVENRGSGWWGWLVYPVFVSLWFYIYPVKIEDENDKEEG